MFRLEKNFCRGTTPLILKGKKKFCWGIPPVKGKIFDTTFGLIHVQTGKKILSRDPHPIKGKNFWHQIWLDACSDWKNFFCPGNPPLVKGKNFDTRFGLIHVHTGINFLSREPPPSKGKNFWHQIWLDTCSDWKKNFCWGTLPPIKGKNFWHQIWLDACSDWKKIFCPGNPPPSKGKKFWHQIWLDTCSHWNKFFVQGPPPVKGKIFDTRFGLIHVQTWKKFLSRDTPSKGKKFWHQILLDTCWDWKIIFCRETPPVKGKNFDTRFGLIHVQTGKKIFVEGPSPPLKGKIFDTRFGLIHVHTGK